MEKIKKVTKALSTVGLAGGILVSSFGVGNIASVSASTTVHYKDVKETDNFYNSVQYLLGENAISKTLPNLTVHSSPT